MLFSTVSNIAAQAIALVTAFFLTPMLIHYFGPDLFGLNAYVLSLVALFNFSALAVSMSLMKYIPEHIARYEYRDANQTVTTVAIFSLAFYAMLGAIVFTLPHYGLTWFNVAPELRQTATSVMHIVGAFTILLFLTPVFDGLLAGLELFHTRNMINLVCIAAQITGYLIVRATNGALRDYVIVVHLGLMVSMLMKAYVTVRRLPFRLTWARPCRSVLKRVMRYNGFHVINHISDQLMYTADKLILQKALGSSSVAYYHIARRAQDISYAFASLPLGAVVPSIAAAYATSDDTYVRKVNAPGTLLYTLLIVPPVLAWAALFRPFVTLWIGPDFRGAVLPGMLLLLTVAVGAPFKVFEHTLVAKGRVAALGGGKALLASANIVASIVLVRRLGLIGVVIPTAAFWLLFYPLLLVFLMRSESSVVTPQALQSMLPAFVLVGIQTGLYLAGYRHFQPASWPTFIAVLLGIYVGGLLGMMLACWLVSRTVAIEALRIAIAHFQQARNRLKA